MLIFDLIIFDVPMSAKIRVVGTAEQKIRKLSVYLCIVPWEKKNSVNTEDPNQMCAEYHACRACICLEQM
jgi:hypothetical protein